MNDSIFKNTNDFGHREARENGDVNEFLKVLKSRRSVRVFKQELLPESEVLSIIKDGLKAPNSSNLQPWQFLWVRSKEKKEALSKACFGQNGAKTASDLIVCVARTDTWKINSLELLNILQMQGPVPNTVKHYYTKIVPFAYGGIGFLSPLKWLFITLAGILRMVPREPIWPSQLKTWAIKSTALACENIMLSARARGFDSLPMEGYDSKRVRKILNLHKHQHIVMIIALGHGAEDGIYGPQIRLDQDKFITKI